MSDITCKPKPTIFSETMESVEGVDAAVRKGMSGGQRATSMAELGIQVLEKVVAPVAKWSAFLPVYAYQAGHYLEKNEQREAEGQQFCKTWQP